MKKRVSLFDEKGERIRGKENKKAAHMALVGVRLSEDLRPAVERTSNECTVARVCDVYLADLHHSAIKQWANQVQKWLNAFCTFCGAGKVREPKMKHLGKWIQKHVNMSAHVCEGDSCWLPHWTAGYSRHRGLIQIRLAR